MANAWGGETGGKKEMNSRRRTLTLDLKVEFVTTGVKHAQCTEGIFENQSFPLFHSCNVYRFDRIFICYLPPPLTMSRNSITDRCLIGQNSLHQNVGQQLSSFWKTWALIMTSSQFYTGRQSLMQMSSIENAIWLNTFLYKQHFLWIWSAHCCIITQMCPSSGENMANEELVTETFPKKPIQLLSFLQTSCNYSLITSVRLLTCAECCGANTVWTPAATPLGR